jgi:mRNA-degrading endonuclease YafQ of YafQ-DinJ toxin-antitoxin module
LLISKGVSVKNYELEFTTCFARKYSKLVKHNLELQKQIQTVLLLLQKNPKLTKLRTHKVKTTKYGLVFSSRVNGDIRIIWNFSESKIIISLLDIGGHSGKYCVYK